MKTDQLKPPRLQLGTLRAAAFHEAGHVAMADFFQVRTVEASIEWDASSWTDGYVENDGRQMRGLDWTSFAIIVLAGGEAQRKFDRHSWRGWHTEEDERDAYNAVRHLARSEAETEVYLHCLKDSARTLLAHPGVWRVVEAIAEALLERGKLRGVEVDRIVNASRNQASRKR